MFSKHLITVIAVFIAIFLVATAINAQPMFSPYLATAAPPPGKGGGPNCPTGTTYNDATRKSQAAPTCPQGSTLQNGQCVTLTLPTCPAGTTGPNDQGQCTSTTTASACPQGSTFSNGNCVTVTQITCPTGTAPNDKGTCVAQSTCPSGTTLNGNVCAGYPVPKPKSK